MARVGPKTAGGRALATSSGSRPPRIMRALAGLCEAPLSPAVTRQRMARATRPEISERLA